VTSSFEERIQGRSARLAAAVARLDALVNWEQRVRGGARGMRLSLDPVRDLCARLGSPERAFRAVHVAGSKGKGGTSALVESSLRSAGVRTALYTSPHVERIEERLTICGAEVAGDVLAVALERSLAARERALADGSAARDATWFDVLTAAAFLVAAESGVELAVVECGLGGRLDSTNVVHGPVAAITSIYLEHTAVLGSTRAAIAGEKAGIVKPGATVVVAALTSEDEAAAVVERVAREQGARCVRVEHAPADPIELRNLHLARAVLAELELCEPELAARAGGFALDEAARWRARLPGRAERRWLGATRIVLDGAHVPESLELVLRDLAADPELAAPPVAVLGCGREKNARGLLKALRGRVDRVLCSSVGQGPQHDPAELAALARELGLGARSVPDPAAALVEAARVAGTGGWVLVTDSLHLVGAVRRHTRP
jgi:dihydrofolate synthase/folylpolyglutamate synthase